MTIGLLVFRTFSKTRFGMTIHLVLVRVRAVAERGSLSTRAILPNSSPFADHPDNKFGTTVATGDFDFTKFNNKGLIPNGFLGKNNLAWLKSAPLEVITHEVISY